MHILWITRGDQPTLVPPLLRERAGFQSNAQMGGARSTGNLRVRGNRGVPAGFDEEAPPVGPRRRRADADAPAA